MRKTFILGLALLSASVVAMPKNSFLICPANNLEQLMIQIEQSPVSERYCNFYGVSQEKLNSVFARMRQKPLTENHKLKVWRCTPKGYGVNYQHLKKGTLVWVFENGSLALLLSCGNPLSRNLYAPVGKTSLPEVVLKPVEAPLKLVDIPAAQISAPVLLTPSTPVVPMTSTTEAPFIQPDTPTFTSSGRNDLFPMVIAGLGVYSLTQHNNCPPVPEPTSMLVLGAGLIGIMVKRKK